MARRHLGVVALLVALALSACGAHRDSQGGEGGDHTGGGHQPSRPPAGPTARPTVDPSTPGAATGPSDPGQSVGAPTAPQSTSPAEPWWVPRNPTSFQYLLGSQDTSVPGDIVVLDGADTPAAKVDALHAEQRRAVCYVNAGAWEDWRDDADAFPAAVLGHELDGWPGERWLDVRATSVLTPIIEARVATCVRKRFDAVEFDNVDGYTNRTGFTLSAADQLAFNRSLAAIAHRAGLAVGLKNDVDQIDALEPAFDFAINEECLKFDECAAYAPFVRAGKVVLHVEYRAAADFCSDPTIAGFTSIAKKTNLGAWRRSCR